MRGARERAVLPVQRAWIELAASVLGLSHPGEVALREALDIDEQQRDHA